MIVREWQAVATRWLDGRHAMTVQDSGVEVDPIMVARGIGPVIDGPGS